MNDGNSISLQYHKVTVHNYCMPQFELFQTLTTPYKQRTNHKLGCQIKEKKISINFLFSGISENFTSKQTLAVNNQGR